MARLTPFIIFLYFVATPAFAEQKPLTCDDLARNRLGGTTQLTDKQQQIAKAFFDTNNQALAEFALGFIDEATALKQVNPFLNGLDVTVGIFTGLSITTRRLNLGISTTGTVGKLPKNPTPAQVKAWLLSGIAIDTVYGTFDFGVCTGIRYALSRTQLIVQLPPPLCQLPKPPKDLDGYFQSLVKGQDNSADRYSELVLLYGILQKAAQNLLADVSNMGRGGFSFNVGYTCGTHSNSVLKYAIDLLGKCSKLKFKYYMAADLLAKNADHEYNGIVAIPSDRSLPFKYKLARRKEQTELGNQTGVMLQWDGEYNLLGYAVPDSDAAKKLGEFNGGTFGDGSIIATLDAMPAGSNDTLSWLGGPVPIAGPVAAVLCDVVPKQGSPAVKPKFDAVGAKHKSDQLILIPADFVDGVKR
jgi:hypothetical protein